MYVYWPLDVVSVLDTDREVFTLKRRRRRTEEEGFFLGKDLMMLFFALVLHRPSL